MDAKHFFIFWEAFHQKVLADMFQIIRKKYIIVIKIEFLLHGLQIG